MLRPVFCSSTWWICIWFSFDFGAKSLWGNPKWAWVLIYYIRKMLMNRGLWKMKVFSKWIFLFPISSWKKVSEIWLRKVISSPLTTPLYFLDMCKIYCVMAFHLLHFCVGKFNWIYTPQISFVDFNWAPSFIFLSSTGSCLQDILWVLVWGTFWFRD